MSDSIVERKPWYRQLWVWVFLAMLAGVVTGHVAPQFGIALQPLSDIFIRAIRLLIAPLIFCSVVGGIAKMGDSARVGRLAVKSLLYFEIITSVALLVALVLVNVLRPGDGMHLDGAHLNSSALDALMKQAPAAGSVVGFLTTIIPATLVGALAEGNVLQVLFVSVLCGFALSAAKSAGLPLLQVVGAAGRMIFNAVDIVMWIAPLGAFAAMGFTVGKFGVGSLAALGKLVLDFYLICVVFITVAFGAMAVLCRFSLLKLLRYLGDEILVCIATTSSEVVLPRLIEKMKRAGCDPNVVDLVVPAGYSFNLDGTCLYLATTAVFLAQATDTPLSLGQQMGLLGVLLITSKGAAGVAGAALVVLVATLSANEVIPVASVAVLLGVHRLLSQGLTPTNLIGNAIATIAMSKWEGNLAAAQLRQALDATPSAEASTSAEVR